MDRVSQHHGNDLFKTTLFNQIYQPPIIATAAPIPRLRPAVPNFPAAPVGELVDPLPAGEGAPEAVAVESEPLAFLDSPVIGAAVTPVPLVHSVFGVSLLVKVISAHCKH